LSIRIGVYGWGIVAPKSPNVDAFQRNLACADTWLTPFDGFGPDNFLVGKPDFQFSDYEDWIKHRFAPRHYQKLKEKMGMPSLYAIGAFIQSLSQNPGIEDELHELGSLAQVYVGTGLGSLDTTYQASVSHYKSQIVWDRFWAAPERNTALRNHSGDSLAMRVEKDSEEWNRYWMSRSAELQEYLSELAHIDSLSIDGEVETAKLHMIREKEKRHAKLREKWGAPEPPWHVSADLIWNIHNTPAAQISILGKITGLSFAPVAACSTFGVALGLAMRAIQSGDAKLVVVGATDPPPHPLTVGSFYSARVLSASRTLSLPLTGLQGTHISGGSVIWIVADRDYMHAKGFKPLGMEPLSVGLSSDAHHIITPSVDGPRLAIHQALTNADIAPEALGTWDLHATATPGDYTEVSTLRSVLPESVLVTARKGTFGHGMSAGSGWELTAQYLGYEQGRLFPTPLRAGDLNHMIAGVHNSFVFNRACAFPDKPGGKLSMGIGGINACVISRPW
jgi:3-oxoacyl-[acyl-carrier-protein] synthase II